MAFKNLSCFLTLLLITIHCHKSLQFSPLKIETGNKKTFYIETFFKANWFRAHEFCKFHGMELASINNIREHDALTQALPSNEYFWTGGNDLAEVGSWFWSSTGNAIKFSKWNINEPNGLKGVERCIEYFHNLLWNDENCDSLRYFVCEKIE